MLLLAIYVLQPFCVCKLWEAQVAVEIYDCESKLKLWFTGFLTKSETFFKNNSVPWVQCSRRPLQHLLKLTSNINVMMHLVQIDNNSPLHAYAVLAVCSAAMRCKVTLLLPAASFSLHVKRLDNSLGLEKDYKKKKHLWECMKSRLGSIALYFSPASNMNG